MPRKTINEYSRERILTRRTFILGGLQLAGFSVLAGRLWYLQVIERDRYRVLAEENRIAVRLIAPNRGQILDRNGTVMAGNTQNFQVIALPEQIEDRAAFLARFAELIPLEDAQLKRIERELKKRGSVAPVLLYDNLSWEQVAALELHAPELPGLSIETGEVRNYPFGENTAHILGHVGAVTEREQERARDKGETLDPLLTLPGFRIGKAGIEKQYESTLRGIAGGKQLEVNAHGRIVRELASHASVSGEPLHLTIDMGLQQILQQRLSAEQSAAAVVMDVNSGAVYALGSHPSFDPNLFTFGIGSADWTRLNTDEHTPLHNKVLSGQYPPGSTFKMMTALAALDSGIVNENTAVHCPGYMALGNHRFHCWRREGHGAVSMVGGLAHSCDVYFYELARRIGIDRIAAMATRFGMGAKTGIDVPGERTGLIPTRSWRFAAKRQNWQQGETLIAGIGQGSVLATPLQLAVMAARIANGGHAVVPHLKQRSDDKAPDWPDLGIRDRHLDIIRRGMNAVVNQPGATAYGSRIAKEGFEMAGKTGSAQVRRITAAERATGVIKNENLPWIQRDHALFVAYAPVQAPRFAMGVIVEHGGGGSKVAAPIARDILLDAQRIIV